MSTNVTLTADAAVDNGTIWAHHEALWIISIIAFVQISLTTFLLCRCCCRKTTTHTPTPVPLQSIRLASGATKSPAVPLLAVSYKAPPRSLKKPIADLELFRDRF